MEIKWNLEGERNSRFFHLYAMNRKIINHISWVQKLDGGFIEKEEEISSVLREHFQALLTTKDTLPLLDTIHISKINLTQSEQLHYRCRNIKAGHLPHPNVESFRNFTNYKTNAEHKGRRTEQLCYRLTNIIGKSYMRP